MQQPLELELDLIGDIYDAALDARLWQPVLSTLATLTGANSAILTARDALNADYTVAFTHNIPAQALAAYRQPGIEELEMRLASPMTRAGVGSTLLSSEAFGSQEEFVRQGGDFYRHCLAPANVHFMAATLLDHDEFRWAVLGIHRPADAAPLGHEHAALLRRLNPHVRRALQIHRQIVSVQRRNAQLYGILDHLATGVILVDSRARPRHANAQAEHLLRRNGLLRLTTHQLLLDNAEQQQRLGQLIDAAIASSQRKGRGELPGGVLSLGGNGAPQQLMLTVVPLSEMAGYEELAHDDVAAAIFLSDPKARLTLSFKLLRTVYRLTERECDVCAAFANSGALEQTAAECGISLASVRTYMKDIYAKTGQRSQAELMRLLLGLRLNFEHIR